MAVMRFVGEYEFLSNFYHAPYITDYVKADGSTGKIIVDTVEHEFQAGKASHLLERHQILMAPTPMAAKKLGRRCAISPLWDREKEEWMYGCLKNKFKQNWDLALRLLATEGQTLVEGNHWHDNYWGMCDCDRCGTTPGKNRLGHLLMMLRRQLRDELSGK